METILPLLAFASICYIIAGLINPKFVPKSTGRLNTLRTTIPIFILVVVVGAGLNGVMESVSKKQAEITQETKVKAEIKLLKERKAVEAKEAEERKLAEAKEALQKEVLDKMDAYILSHVAGFKIETVSNNWYQLSVYIKHGVMDDSARKIAMHTVKAIIDNLVKQGRQSADEKVDVFVTAEHKKLGATGKELFRSIGMSTTTGRATR